MSVLGMTCPKGKWGMFRIGWLGSADLLACIGVFEDNVPCLRESIPWT